MSDRATTFGEELAAIEPASAAGRERYERRLRDIFEERLSMPARGCCLAVGAACVLFGGGAALVVFSDREAYRYWPNLVLGAVVSATAMAIGGALVGVAVRGVYRRQVEGRWAATSGLVMLAAWGLFMVVAAFGLPDFLRDVFLTLGIVCLGAAVWLAQRIAAARGHLLLEKRLLEIEQRLADTKN